MKDLLSLQYCLIFSVSHNIQLMRRQRSSITEQYSPTIRRRLNTNYLDLSIKINEKEYEQQKFNPNKLIEKAKQQFEYFANNHQKINKIIDSVDEIIKKRMQVHEKGLLEVVKSQIDRMQRQCYNIVSQYNQMIEQKNKEMEIDQLKNEVDYFRFQAFNSLQKQTQLVKQNKKLKQLLKQKDAIIEQLNKSLKRAYKKIFKQKLNSRKEMTDYLVQNILHVPPIQTSNAFRQPSFRHINSISQRKQKDKGLLVIKQNPISSRYTVNRSSVTVGGSQSKQRSSRLITEVSPRQLPLNSKIRASDLYAQMAQKVKNVLTK